MIRSADFCALVFWVELLKEGEVGREMRTEGVEERREGGERWGIMWFRHEDEIR